MEKLKSCPACGEDKAHVHFGLRSYCVMCDNKACRLIGPNADTQEGAIQKWNELPRREDKPTPVFINNVAPENVIFRMDGDRMVWDARIDGCDWHTVFIFDGPRTYVVASLDRNCDTFSGMSRCNPKDEYNRYTGMREAVNNMRENEFHRLLWKHYLHAFRVWINQFDPVWTPK